MVLEAARVAGVIVLLGVAACLASPPGKLPLALRGIRKILRRDSGTHRDAEMAKVSAGRRFVAFLLVIVAVVVAMA